MVSCFHYVELWSKEDGKGSELGVGKSSKTRLSLHYWEIGGINLISLNRSCCKDFRTVWNFMWIDDGTELCSFEATKVSGWDLDHVSQNGMPRPQIKISWSGSHETLESKQLKDSRNMPFLMWRASDVKIWPKNVSFFELSGGGRERGTFTSS